jgi:hypothetical protein
MIVFTLHLSQLLLVPANTATFLSFNSANISDFSCQNFDPFRFLQKNSKEFQYVNPLNAGGTVVAHM